ncbi:glycoside hydrolase family 61 protein [Truncatella angustata]|uniref:lytic cellulose monooxygenase (C4-dehydrogenating) n=1 Tax=Truncatella angustata TaxID=152316 RepID=A0A9P8RE41_9PEZI|nr:glycoside hydrolase family 61 protein [Truncatella angustata]KAH6638585.1 glycoside hydrolase family 61 protein [Truncatella angustata]
MKSFVGLSLVAVVFGHYTFPDLIYNGVTSDDWEYIRQTTNYQSHGPVQDVTSSQLRCYELTTPSTANGTQTVAAGSTVSFRVDPAIQHPGPLQFYLAKVPSGQTAASFDGAGSVWFKIYEEHPTITADAITFASSGLAQVGVTIPSCVAPGDYLLRVEHIALHSASSTGGAQFYIGCAQLTVTGSGTKTFSGVAFPGAYAATDPGILINIYWPIPTNYTNPGPAPVSC